MGRRLDFVLDTSVWNECGASASEADMWRNPDGGWKPSPPIWAARGAYINPPALRGALSGCLFFFVVSIFVLFLNKNLTGGARSDFRRLPPRFLPFVS